MGLFTPEPIRWLQLTIGPAWEGVVGGISLLGSVWGLLVAMGLARWIWGRTVLYGVLAALILESLSKKGLAATFPVPRPDGSAVVQYRVVEGVSSFPSGHVGSATAVWAAMAFLRRIPFWVPWLVGVSVAASRLYLGVHWLGDVIAAIALGFLAAWLATLDGLDAGRRLDQLSSVAWQLAGLAALAGVALQVALLLGDNVYAWKGAGLIAGLGLALPAERRWTTGDPGELPPGRAFRRTLLGLAGLSVFAAAAMIAPAVLHVQAILTSAGALWSLLGAPLVFDRWPAIFGSPDR